MGSYNINIQHEKRYVASRATLSLCVREYLRAKLNDVSVWVVYGMGVGKTGSGNGRGSGRCVGKTGIWEREITWSGNLFYY